MEQDLFDSSIMTDAEADLANLEDICQNFDQFARHIFLLNELQEGGENEI